jgi:hypothetical protein
LAADKNHEKLKVLLDSLPEYLENIQLDYNTNPKPGPDGLHS